MCKEMNQGRERRFRSFILMIQISYVLGPQEAEVILIKDNDRLI